MTEKLSIIFVVGAWHTEYHAEPIIPYLESYGYRVVPVKLHTTNNVDPLPVIRDNIEGILRVIKAEVAAGHRICMVGHSVSGQSVAGAMTEFLQSSNVADKSKLLHAIFISCFWDPIRSLAEQDWYEIADMQTSWATMHKPAEDVFYNDMPKQEAKRFVDALQYNRGQMPKSLTDEWKTDVECTYFLCQKDKAVPPKFQKMEAEENAMKIVEVDMDHCPYVSRPKELAEKMHEVLKKY